MHLSQACPSNYIQEQGILRDSGGWVRKFGAKPLIITGKTAWSKVGNLVKISFEEEELDVELIYHSGDCTYEEVDRIVSLVSETVDLIIGVGGGQCMDTSKLVAEKLNLPIVTISTLASTCAAVSTFSIMYTPEHIFVDVVKLKVCPVLTLVDPDVIRDAPLKYLISGVGDTIVKWYEAEPINRGKVVNAKIKTGMKLAELTKEILFEHGEQAIKEQKECKTGDALRQVIDTNILISGLVGGIGQESCKSSGAHAINYGMTNIKAMKHVTHGEIVAYGLLTQVALEGFFEEVNLLMDYYLKIGLPICLSDLTNETITNEELKIAAAIATGRPTIHLLHTDITEEKVYETLIKIDEIGRRKKEHLLEITK